MTTNMMADIIIKDLCGKSFPVFLTTYNGQGMDECDVFGINRNGYSYEFEIKMSRSDFQAEFRNKIHKHKKLNNRDAVKVYDEWKNGKRTGEKCELIQIPNRYFFVCPKGLILPNEVPEYAGLIYVYNNPISLKEVKPAKLLHRNKANIKMYERAASILSQRIIYGCSYYTYLQTLTSEQ